MDRSPQWQNDPIIQDMEKRGVEVTRESYLQHCYLSPDEVPEELDEDLFPPELRLDYEDEADE